MCHGFPLLILVSKCKINVEVIYINFSRWNTNFILQYFRNDTFDAISESVGAKLAKAIKRNLRKKLGFCPDRWGPSFPQDTQNKIIINFISHIILFQAISHWRAPQSLWYHIPNFFGHSFTQIDCYAILQATNTVQYNVVLWMSYVAR